VHHASSLTAAFGLPFPSRRSSTGVAPQKVESFSFFGGETKHFISRCAARANLSSYCAQAKPAARRI
jgi:hypothetical protein